MAQAAVAWSTAEWVGNDGTANGVAWRGAHEALLRLAQKRAGLDFEEGRWLLAALRAGIKTVMLPVRNKRDLEDIPADAREQLTFVWLETVDQAIETALEPVKDAAAALAA